MMIRVGRPLKKAWSLVGHGPAGAQIFRNPPPQAFRPEGEDDLPAHAHDGVGNLLPGQWAIGEHGQKTYQTDYGDFHHPIDAVAHRLGDFLRARGFNIPVSEVINNAINEFNDTHSHGDAHALAGFDSPEWRKIRASDMPGGDATREKNTMPARTKGGTKITMLTNKNHMSTPVGKFVEGGYIPFHRNITHQLEDMGIPTQEIRQGLKFLDYPWMQPHFLTPKNFLVSNQKQHGADIDEAMMGRGPEGYFGETEGVHTWEVLHHLPDAFFYPNVKANMQKKGKQPTGLYKAAHNMIDKALQQGMEHIPNVNVTVNTGTLGAPQMINRPLHEILQTPDLREAMVKDMAHVPAMMFLFGRSGQGDFKRLYDHMMEKYGASEDMLSAGEQAKYLSAGSKGGKGMHESAKRMFALARASGEGSEEGRSRFGEHGISADELQAMGMHHSDALMNQVDRFRGVLEALADHQASAQGHQVKRGIGDIPTTARPGMSIGGYPELNTETGEYSMPPLDEHMDAYFHQVHDFAPTEAFDPSLSPSPEPQVISSPVQPASPVAVPSPAPSPVRAAPSSFPHTARQQFQQMRPQVGQLDPMQFRQLLEQSGRRRPMPMSDAPLSPYEARMQGALADPQQQFLSDYFKSNDSVMDEVMRIVKGGRR
tara:strand:- start:20206 stop:22164 length:1959 start_codon:yes stop_codon:yes gene_type:complete